MACRLIELACTVVPSVSMTTTLLGASPVDRDANPHALIREYPAERIVQQYPIGVDTQIQAAPRTAPPVASGLSAVAGPGRPATARRRAAPPGPYPAREPLRASQAGPPVQAMVS